MVSTPRQGDGATEALMLQEVAGAIAASNLIQAGRVANLALAQGMRHPIFYNARALLAQQQDRLQDALDDFQRALAFTPKNPVLLNAIGLALVRLNRAKEGVAAFDAALDVTPKDAVTLYRKGWALESASEPERAAECYEQALALKPDLYEALSGLAVIAARASDQKKARDYAERALAFDPREPTAVLALAMADIAEKRFEDAEKRLRPMLREARVVGHTRALMLGFLGDALDGQDRIDEAFQSYTAGNNEFRRVHIARFRGDSRVKAVIDHLVAYFDAAPTAQWNVPGPDEPDAQAPKGHVFLLGFLRTGTTLLEQVLSMSPEVVKLEERETLSETSRKYLRNVAGLDALAAMNPAEQAEARALYWGHVKNYGVNPRGKIFIDKQPLNTFNLPLIARMFPKAKILFAVRDPRDVVLSCFRRHFEVNANTFELLSLPDAAAFYAAIMRLAELCREKLPLDLHEHRYESMIEDFDASVRAACDFIGAPWTEAMRDFSKSASAQKIRSPSAAQVRRGLYGEGVGQWRRYARQMAPAMPILKPWIEKFGYPAD